jgi:predicted RNA methylase
MIYENMTEKASQVALFNLMIENGFDKDHIIYTPSKNKLLKEVFQNCSKTGNGRGIPDLIYLEDNVMFICECKPSNLPQALCMAEKDIFIYRDKMNLSPIQHYETYFVAFVDETNYKIYDMDKTEIKKKLFKQLFLKKKTKQPSMQDLRKHIHDIHNYIRNYTKISDEDKPFFIAIILVSNLNESFRILWKLKKDTLHVYDLLVENLKEHDIDISIFDFMRKDNNNEHFSTIIEKILKICDSLDENLDLLNLFYNEFVKYKNSDKKRGIVLTPNDIVKIMVDMADIQKDDIVLDLCTGTGSFLWKCLQYQPKKIIGCEFQGKLFELLKCNNILQNKDNKVESEFKKDNCFSHHFKCTKSIINPPFAEKNEKELDFVHKQLDSLEEGGIAVSIFPISKLTSPSTLRDDLLEKAQVKTIVILNEKVFYNSHAGVKCVILVLEKNKNGHLEKTKIVDFSEDGFEMKRTFGRHQKENYNTYVEKFYKDLKNDIYFTIGKETRNWISDYYRNVHNQITDSDLKERMLEEELFLRKKMILCEATSKLFSFHSKKFQVQEIFNILKKPRVKYDGNDTFIFEVAARKYDNGIKKIISVQDVNREKIFTGKKIVLVTGGDGGGGMAYYQSEPFTISSSTVVLEPKEIDLNPKLGHFLALELSKYKKIYDRGYGWNMERMKSDIVCVPFCEKTKKIQLDSF